MTVITDSKDLAAFCRRLSEAEFVTVDTEFMRERTYWPHLCLVQLGGPDEAAAVDALAEGIDLAPLFDLLANPDILKVFHAARQDIEIFYHMSGTVPAPLFDSQIAAMVCGFGESVSYEILSGKLAKARIDKSLRFTDWARRPLSDRQIQYAIGDVTHLRVIYEALRSQLEKRGRAAWVAEEMAALLDPELYVIDPNNAWKRLKMRSRAPRLLAILRELAAWRETEARRRDVPRQRVLRDEAIVGIAAQAPNSKQELTQIRGVGGGTAALAEPILEAVARGKAVPEDQCPEPPPNRHGLNAPEAQLDLLRVLLKMKSEEHHVAPRLIAAAADIERIAAGETEGIAALGGWRHEIFGADALALREGRLALAVAGETLCLVPLDGDDAPALPPPPPPKTTKPRRRRRNRARRGNGEKPSEASTDPDPV